MQKMLIVLPKMSMGGMERSAVNLINLSNYTKNFEVTLLVGYIADDSLFQNITSKVNIKVLYKRKWNKYGKLISTLKYLGLYFYYMFKKSKYDISICYSHHHGVLASLSRKASKNNIIFIHNDLIEARTKKQIEVMKFDEFKKVVCVSNAAKETFLKLFSNYSTENVNVINNYIDGESILKMSEDEIKDLDIEGIKKENILFVNVSRHLESAKKISRIINAVEKLKSDGYKFKLLLVGDGKDTEYYKELVSTKKLEDTILFLGNKTNPYNYIKDSDALLLSSVFEGYGMVLDEARVLNIPFISTDVADARIISDQGYGIICENDDNGIYDGMKKYLDKGHIIKNKFDYIDFNNNITNKLDEITVF